MKKLLLLTAIFATCFSVKTFAQKGGDDGEFKPFKVDVSAGYALPMGGTGSKGGLLFVVEPKYAVSQQISLGLRLEGAVTVSGIDAAGNVANNASAKAAASYLATGDYYFNSNDFRPFAGAGAGIFSTAGVTTSTTNTNVAQGSKFGGMIRLGFEYKHARFGVEYNIIPKTSVADDPSTPSNDAYEIKNAYIGIKFGVCIGGGRR